MQEAIKTALISIWNAIGFKLIAAILILVIGLKLAGFLSRKIIAGKGFRKLHESVQSFLASCIKVLFYVLVVFTAAYTLGIPMTSFITILASAGVAVGLALQGALSNFAGGLMILIFKPFEVGDYVEASGYSGTVSAITVFYTVLITLDRKRVTLPNGNLTAEAVVNYSSEPVRRVDIDFNVSHRENIDIVTGLIAQVAMADERVLLDEPDQPFVRLTDLKENSMTVTLRVLCKTADYWPLKYSLTENVKKAFDEAGIEIPLPQLDVHMRGKNAD